MLAVPISHHARDAGRDDSSSAAATAVITDVGSVKGWVVRELEPMLGPGWRWSAVHPVAGKETTGAGAADESCSSIGA